LRIADLREIAGKHIRKTEAHSISPALPKTRPLAGLSVPVDQDDVPSPLLQVQGGADADHARAQYEDIGL